MPIALTNVNTKKIVGCKNAYEKRHEQAHIIYSESARGMFNEYLKQTCEYFALISIILGHWISMLNYVALATIAVSIYLYIYEEVWCHEKAEGYKK